MSSRNGQCKRADLIWTIAYFNLYPGCQPFHSLIFFLTLAISPTLTSLKDHIHLWISRSDYFCLCGLNTSILTVRERDAVWFYSTK